MDTGVNFHYLCVNYLHGAKEMMWAMYFSMGLGVYCGAAACRKDTFDSVEVPSFFRGLILGVVLWPLALFFLMLDGET